MKQPSKESVISNKHASDRAPSEAGASKTLLQTPKEALGTSHQKVSSPKSSLKKPSVAEHFTQTDMQMKDVLDARTSPLSMMMFPQGTQVSPAGSQLSQ